VRRRTPHEQHPDDHLPYVSVEHVSRRYEPIRVRRIEHIFAVLGGIVPGEGGNFEDEEEDLLEEEEQDVERVSQARIALDDVSFEARGGSCLALIGPAGSGKSVLAKIIAGLAPPTSGRVVVHGRVAAAIDSSAGLFPRTGRVRAGLPLFAGFHGIPPRLARRHMQEIADFLVWPDLRKQHMSLLTTKHRRSLMLTLALLVEADIVLIDGAMPPGPTVKWQERMLELKRSGVLLIVTGQSVEAVSWIADRVIHLERGVIIGDERIDPTNEAPGLEEKRLKQQQAALLEAELVPTPGEL
jgi:ABC-type polysaccharide/polyol phosphate transport system ATPase subunit